MLRPELIEMLEQLFAIGGNQDTIKYIKIRKKLVAFLKTEDFLVDYKPDENLLVARDAIHFIDANIIYAKSSNIMEAGNVLKPFFERLLQLDKWNFYELTFLISLIHFNESVEQALKLNSKATHAIRRFGASGNVVFLKSSLSCNMCCRLLSAKFFDKDINIDLINMEFHKWYHELESLVRDNDKLALDFLVAKIRKAVFNTEVTEIDELLKELKKKYKKVYDLIISEVDFYRQSLEFQELFLERLKYNSLSFSTLYFLSKSYFNIKIMQITKVVNVLIKQAVSY